MSSSPGESKTMDDQLAAGVSTAQVVGPTHPTSNPAVRSTFQTVLTDQSAADIQAAPRSTARLSTTVYVGYLARRLLAPLPHWMGRACREKKGRVRHEGGVLRRLSWLLATRAGVRVRHYPGTQVPSHVPAEW